MPENHAFAYHICRAWYNGSYNPSNLFARTRLVYTRHVTEYSPAKTSEISIY